MTQRAPALLIVEDGDEYLINLSKLVVGPIYYQAKNGNQALALLQKQPIDLVYLDMRFDRIPKGDLLGDHARCTQEHNGDPVRAWKYLQNNQGLYILSAMRQAGFGSLPVILAYDFSNEPRRLAHLTDLYPALRWVKDAVTPGEIRKLIDTLLQQ